MPVLVVTAFPEPQHRAEVFAAFETAITRVHDERGVEVYALHEGPDRLVMIEKYESEDARAQHAKGGPLADLLSALEGNSPALWTPSGWSRIRLETRRRGLCSQRRRRVRTDRTRGLALPRGDWVATAVIGATGRVGSEIVRGLVARGDAVTALVRDHDGRAHEGHDTPRHCDLPVPQFSEAEDRFVPAACPFTDGPFEFFSGQVRRMPAATTNHGRWQAKLASPSWTSSSNLSRSR